MSFHTELTLGDVKEWVQGVKGNNRLLQPTAVFALSERGGYLLSVPFVVVGRDSPPS